MGKNRKWIQLVILAAVLIIGGLTIGSALFEEPSGAPLKPGQKAPAFTSTGLDGQTYKLSDLKGKPVVLNFWGTFCPPCREEMPDLQRQADLWADQGVSIIGMNLAENVITVKSFVNQYNIRFPIYLDEDEKIRKTYGVYQYPTTFFIRPDGTIHEIKIGLMNEAYIERTIRAMLAVSP